MTMKLIKTEADHQAALQRLDELFDLDPAVGSEESNEIDVLALLIETYEQDAFPLELPSPIEAIRFRMDQQGLAQKDLVPYIGSKSKVSEVLNGKRALSLNMIRNLHAGLGIPYDVLMQDKATFDSEVEVEWSAFPIAEMNKRGLFGKIDTGVKHIKEYAEDLMCELFSKILNPMELSPSLLRSTAQLATNEKQDDPYALWAWQVEVQLKASQLDICIYKEESLTDEFMRSLAQFSVEENGPILAIKKLNEIGIRVVVIPKYTKTYLDGAAFLLEGNQPAIALTLRHNRLDNFWFTLMHELAHIHLHLNQNTRWILDDLDKESLDRTELEANELAQNSLIPCEYWSGIVGDEYDIEQVAKKANIHRALVAGRYRFEQKDHSKYSQLVQEPVRQYFQ